MIAELLLALAGAADYAYLPAAYCQQYEDCLKQMPRDRVVATTVFLADIADYGAMNQVYEKHFSGLKPARNTVAVKLPGKARMGINAVVYQGAGSVRGLTPPNVTNVVPITPGILTPDRLFIAGILGRDSNTGQIPIAPDAQIEMCLNRLTRVLATASLTPSALIQATVYHTAAIPREVLDTHLRRYLGEQPSIAITILEVPALALGANVGLNGIALFLPTGV